MTQRWGMTVPSRDISLPQHREWFKELADRGYTDLWSSEAAACDAFTPLILAAAWQSSLRLGTAIVPAATRGPAVIAQSAAALAEASGNNFVLGIGASSPAIVEDWNGRTLSDPYWQVRDTLTFLRSALSGDRVTADYRTFSVKNFTLGRPGIAPKLMVAGLGPAMLSLSARHADGLILNWLGPDDVARLLSQCVPAPAEVICRIMVCASTDAATVRDAARPLIAAYLSVPGYAALYERLGHAARLAQVWRLWRGGDRKGAVRAVPDEIVDAVVVHGSADRCRTRLQQYVDAGVTTPVLAPAPFGQDPAETARLLGLT